MHKYIPILSWLPSYDKSLLSGDLSAGVTVGIMLVPQGMAYAMLAGLPPIYGLYASTIPLIIYALLGSSRQLAVGPVALISLLVVSGVGAIAEIGSSSFISLAILLALMVGVIQLALGILKLGFLVNFLSHPVISGFTTAAAIIIGFSQLKHLLGLDIPRGDLIDTLTNVWSGLDLINIPTLAVGIGAISIIVTLRKINRKIPSPLIVVLLGLAVVYFLNLDQQGVSIIKDVPKGLPPFSLPELGNGAMISLIPIALTISLVSYMESYAVAKAIQAKHKDYELDPNQELIGLGMANIAGSLFSSFPVTGGFSRSAVNDQAGAKTAIATIISALIVLLTLLFLTPYFYYLPKAVLAAIIIVAVYGLLDIKEAKHLWHKDKIDFVTFMITALATLFIGIEPGIAIGVLFSLLAVLYKISYPHITELGQIPDKNVFRNVSRFDNLATNDENLILRFDAQLFFANSNTFKNTILSKLTERPAAQHVIIEASGIHQMDSSAIHMLEDLNNDLKKKNIKLQFADVKGPLRDIFKRYGLFEKIGKSNFYLSVNDAIESNSQSEKNKNDEYIFQTIKKIK